MVLGSRVEVDVGDILQTLQKVGLNLRIGVGKVAAVVFHQHLCLRLCHIGHTHCVLARLLVLVGGAEEIGEHEMGVGADQESLPSG